MAPDRLKAEIAHLPLSPGKASNSSSCKKLTALSLCIAGGPDLYTGWGTSFYASENYNFPFWGAVISRRCPMRNRVAAVTSPVWLAAGPCGKAAQFEVSQSKKKTFAQSHMDLTKMFPSAQSTQMNLSKVSPAAQSPPLDSKCGEPA